MKKSELTRLALSYLAVIMTLSLVFSIIIYTITTAGLNRPLPPDEEGHITSSSIDFIDHSFEDIFEKRLARRDNLTQTNIIISLIGFNVGILIIGTFASRNLAKLTLAPIERAMMKQAQFVSDVSHELKTPLTAMMLRNEVALRKRNLSEEKAREVIAKNIEEIQRMKELTGAMLDVAREGGEKEEETEVDVLDFIEGLREKMRPMAEERGVELKTEAKTGKSSKAKLAEKTLGQILTVFIDNAIKYSRCDRGGNSEYNKGCGDDLKYSKDSRHSKNLECNKDSGCNKDSVYSDGRNSKDNGDGSNGRDGKDSKGNRNDSDNRGNKKDRAYDYHADSKDLEYDKNLSCGKKSDKLVYLKVTRRGKNLYFSVKDDGIGIKKADQKRIFERFYQVDEARTRAGGEISGHGLGLAIAKNLAERQGYRIVLRSSEGQGSEFEVGV